MKFLASGQVMSLAAAPGIWFAHLLAVYGLASFACPAGGIAGLSPFNLSSGGVALLTLAGLALCAYAATANFRKLRTDGGSAATEGGGAAAFLARANMLLHAQAMLAMLWIAWPALVLSPCTV